MKGWVAAISCLFALAGGFSGRLFAAELSVLSEPSDAAARSSDDTRACGRAATLAEQEEGLPGGLLLAIGQQESGRWDGASGKVLPWPFSTNAAGESRFFTSRREAIGYVETQLRFGVRSIDVGCFQINLKHHPDAFGTLEEAFDPDANARYAAHFLKDLYGQTGRWDAAVGRYHSAAAGPGESYREAVLGRWNGHGRGAGPTTAGAIRLGIEVVAGVIVQRPLAASGQAAAMPRMANLPHVFVPNASLAHRL